MGMPPEILRVHTSQRTELSRKILPQSVADPTAFFFFSSKVRIETILRLFRSFGASFPPVQIDQTSSCSMDKVIVIQIILRQEVPEVFGRSTSMVEEWFQLFTWCSQADDVYVSSRQIDNLQRISDVSIDGDHIFKHTSFSSSRKPLDWCSFMSINPAASRSGSSLIIFAFCLF
jgi:hypothetical protein